LVAGVRMAGGYRALSRMSRGTGSGEIGASPYEVQRAAMPRSSQGMRLDGLPGERSERQGSVCRARPTMAGVGATKGRPGAVSVQLALTDPFVECPGLIETAPEGETTISSRGFFPSRSCGCLRQAARNAYQDLPPPAEASIAGRQIVPVSAESKKKAAISLAARGAYFVWRTPRSNKALRTGRSSLPFSVRRYSARGGCCS
jgi:hypothetical protein